MKIILWRLLNTLLFDKLQKTANFDAENCLNIITKTTAQIMFLESPILLDGTRSGSNLFVILLISCAIKTKMNVVAVTFIVGLLGTRTKMSEMKRLK